MFHVVRETSTQTVLNLLKAKENVNVPLNCPAAKKPQQIVAAQPKHSNKPKVNAHGHTKQILLCPKIEKLGNMQQISPDRLCRVTS